MIRRIAILLALAAVSLWAQESHEPAHQATGHEAAGGHESGDPFLMYKWVNFAILAAGLGYVAVKVGGPALRGQQRAILDQLGAASRRAEAAAAQAAEIDRKVSGLESEIGAIRSKSEAEMASEAQRVEAETAELLAKVDHAAELEIASAEKHARQQIKSAATQLALQLAVDKLRARMTPDSQAALVARFTRRLNEAQQ